MYPLRNVPYLMRVQSAGCIMSLDKGLSFHRSEVMKLTALLAGTPANSRFAKLTRATLRMHEQIIVRSGAVRAAE
jgi:hypothetical protein